MQLTSAVLDEAEEKKTLLIFYLVDFGSDSAGLTSTSLSGLVRQLPDGTEGK